LGDAAKRKRFDDGEIDEQGAERPQRRYYRDFADDDPNPYASGSGFSDLDGAEDILSGIFGQQGRNESGKFKARGGNLHYRLKVEFLDAINGAEKTMAAPDGLTLEITIPPGVREGQVLRLRGKGRPGLGGGGAGDALIEIEVAAHGLFRRDGDDIRIELPISLREAVLGGQIRAPTPTGPVSMTVPPWTNAGAVLRLKGKGAPREAGGRGDEYVTLTLTLPEKPDAELETFVSQWRPANADNPRAAMEARR
jgi:DnaJ-class molecular chaperone